MKYLVGVGVGICIACVAVGIIPPDIVKTLVDSEESRGMLVGAGATVLVYGLLFGRSIANWLREVWDVSDPAA